LTSATIVVAIFVGCSFAANRSEAQAIYYRSIPIGERAMGLGGAYTGIANDPSSTYYNPAGIVTGGRFQLMGSLSSLVFTRRTIENAFAAENVDADFTSTRTTTLPSFIGTVVKFGKKRFGDHQFAIAYSTFEVAREGFGQGLTLIEDPASLDLRLNNNFRDRWYGVSFAAHVRKHVALGLSGFLSDQSSNYSEDVGLASGGTLDAGGQRVGADSITSSTGISNGGYHIVFRLGALYRVNPRWQLGFMFQPPGIPMKQNGSVFRRVTTTASGMEPTYFLFDQGDLSTNVPIPFELRTGFEFKINATTVLSADASVTGPIRDRDLFTRPSEIQDVPGDLGIYFANSVERRWTPNVAVGSEHMFGKAVVAGGLFTNISSAPDVPEMTTEYTPDQVNMFGASFSVGIDTKGYRFTLGATGYFGRGDALSFTLDRDAQVSGYVRTKSNVSALVLYIAGAVSVASKGAKDVQESYKAKKAKKKGAENGEDEKAADESSETGADTDTDTDTDTGADTDTGTGAEPETATEADGGTEAEAPPEESTAEPQ
jgi:long-chain fatty acid transport protein